MNRYSFYVVDGPDSTVDYPYSADTRPIASAVSDAKTIDPTMCHAFRLKRMTQTGRKLALLTVVCLLLSLLFLLNVEIGSLNSGKWIRDFYFLKFDLSYLHVNDLPDWLASVSVARLLGLYDFYQIGLWGYCFGHASTGVLGCSEPKASFWFNPVQVLESEMFIGSSFILPNDIIDALHTLRTCSQIMFGFFCAATCLTFLTLFLVPITIISPRWSIFASAFTFITSLCCLVATVIATILFTVFRNVITKRGSDLNVKTETGTAIFAFMWTATALSVAAWCIQAGQLRRCAGVRDVDTGGEGGSGEKAYQLDTVEKEDTGTHANDEQGECYTSGWYGLLNQNLVKYPSVYLDSWRADGRGAKKRVKCVRYQSCL